MGSDETFAQDMRRRAVAVGSTEKTLSFLEQMRQFHGGGGSAKKKRLMAITIGQVFALAQRVEAAPLREAQVKSEDDSEEEA